MSPNLYPNTLGIKENFVISTIEIKEEIYENYLYSDIFSELLERKNSIIPLGIKL